MHVVSKAGPCTVWWWLPPLVKLLLLLLLHLRVCLHMQIIRQLSLAVAGAAMMFMATSWLFGYLAAQGVHAERDLQQLMAGGRLQVPFVLDASLDGV